MWYIIVLWEGDCLLARWLVGLWEAAAYYKYLGCGGSLVCGIWWPLAFWFAICCGSLDFGYVMTYWNWDVVAF
jgi:hypothetical protein